MPLEYSRRKPVRATSYGEGRCRGLTQTASAGSPATGGTTENFLGMHECSCGGLSAVMRHVINRMSPSTGANTFEMHLQACKSFPLSWQSKLYRLLKPSILYGQAHHPYVPKLITRVLMLTRRP